MGLLALESLRRLEVLHQLPSNRILARAWVGNNETDENETGLGTGGKINREGQGRSLRGIRGSEHVNGRG